MGQAAKVHVEIIIRMNESLHFDPECGLKKKS